MKVIILFELKNINNVIFCTGENAEIRYSIYHVSNNGNNKFSINSETGDIQTIGKLNAGEQYSLTVQATDKGGLFTQAIVEVKVTPGPNTQAPVFDQSVFNIEVSEGATINSTATSIRVRTFKIYFNIIVYPRDFS